MSFSACDRVLARLFLLGRGDGVLEVEEHHVRVAVGGLFDHGRVRGGDGQFGTMKPLPPKRV
jgi:hypothetical protein